MAKKNRIFTGENADKPYLSKYYSRSGRALERRKNKIKEYVGGAKKGTEAHDRYKAIMDNVKKADRDEVRGMDYDDVFDAADELVDDARGMWTAEELEEHTINKINKELGGAPF